MRAKQCWVNDKETIVNCYVDVFQDYVTDETHVFVVHRLRNDWQAYLDFLVASKNCKDHHFGYNNLAFDAQLTEYILRNLPRMRKLSDPDEITDVLFRYAQSVIDKSSRGEFLDYPEFKLSIPVIDIFKLNHWDNAAKRSSLKWIQYSMDWPNMEEMPHDFRKPVSDQKTLDMVVNYCINDVRSTKAIFYYKDYKGEEVMTGQINLRSDLTKEYGVNLLSASETRISKEVFMHYLSEEMGVEKRDLKTMRTNRGIIEVDKIILPSVRFDTPEFQAVHQFFKNLKVDASLIEGEDKKKGPQYQMLHKGVPTVYALGGIHGCARSGIYVAGKGRKIKSADVTSFYPMLAIMNNWSPEHISPEIFNRVYQGFFDKRKMFPKGHYLNYLFKIVLNATYGLSKNRHSFLYDPEFTFRITINGQLLLSMLYEMITTLIPNAVPLMQNTDGLEFIIDEDDEVLYHSICREWERVTKLSLEFVDYDKMVIGDVNNYIATWTEKGEQKVKCKGRFEWEGLALHKNKSFLVIPKALSAYFIDGIDPKDYLLTNTNFFDYCAGAKLKGDWFFEERGVAAGTFFVKKQQKLLRYYISERGNKLIKCHPDGREIQLESGKWLQTTCNQYVPRPFEDYGINMQYYLNAIHDEIRKIESSSHVLDLSRMKTAQLSLF